MFQIKYRLCLEESYVKTGAILQLEKAWSQKNKHRIKTSQPLIDLFNVRSIFMYVDGRK